MTDWVLLLLFKSDIFLFSIQLINQTNVFSNFWAIIVFKSVHKSLISVKKTMEEFLPKFDTNML